MIKTIPLELDGFYYNIIQMPGRQAWTLKIKILNECAGIIKDAKALNLTDDVDAMPVILELIGSAFTNLKSTAIMPIIEEILQTVKYIEGQSKKEVSNASGYDAGRHGLGSLVSIDQFIGKDAYHLPLIIYHVLKANYADFLIQLKQTLGSSFGQNIRSLISKAPASR